MNAEITESILKQLFFDARTFNGFIEKPVHDALLHRLYDIFRWGPTALNSQPARVVFIKSSEGKERLRHSLAPGNVDKSMSAPVTAIVAWDTLFFEHLKTQFPTRPTAHEGFLANPERAQETAMRNSSLQGGYLIIAARLLGLDAGPMSGFDPDKINAEFFPDGRWRANFLVNLGYGDVNATHPRGPRLNFEDAALII